MSALAFRDTPLMRDALWAHPEWWVVAMGLVSWIATVRNAIAQWGHGLHHRASVAGELHDWQIMVVAMMLPVIAFQARAVALRSLAERRHYAVATFVAGYLVPWSVFGAVAASARIVWPGASPWIVPALCAVAAAWTLVPLRERAMSMVYGYAPMLAPDGWRSVRDCTVAGLVIGSWCVTSCWALMLACAFSSHDPLIVGAGGALALAERRSFRPPTRLVVLVCGALALVFAARGLAP